MLDVAVVGAGPAGIAAAIYLKRAGVDMALFERGSVGGLLRNAGLIENYPGLSKPVSGPDLVAVMERHLASLDIPVTCADITQIALKNGSYNLESPKETWDARVVILAVGTFPKPLDIEGASTLEGGLLFYEIADVPGSAKGKRAAVLGGGDAAYDYALNLADRGSEVVIMHRARTPCCLPLLEERAKAHPAVEIMPETFPHTLGRDTDGRVLIHTEGFLDPVKTDFVLAALGRLPELSLLDDVLAGGETLPGLFIAGDVRRGRFRQTGIAVGDGQLAAMSAVEYLKGGSCP